VPGVAVNADVGVVNGPRADPSSAGRPEKAAGVTAVAAGGAVGGIGRGGALVGPRSPGISKYAPGAPANLSVTMS
jgi:hypothetical protein